MKKIICIFLAVSLLLLGGISPVIAREIGDGKGVVSASLSTPNPIEMEVVPTSEIKAGESVHIDTLFTTAKSDVVILSIELIPSTDISVFPFKIEKSSYIQKYEDVTEGSYPIQLVSRMEAATNYYELKINVTYLDRTLALESTASFNVPVFVHAIAVKPTQDPTPAPNPAPTPESEIVRIPKIIIDNTKTNPEKVVAGETFELDISFKNTSSTVSVSNIKASLSSGDGIFTPVSGSSTIFISRIDPGQVKTETFELLAKSDTVPGSYIINFVLEYDGDSVDGSISATENIAVPVSQTPKAHVTSMQLTPFEAFLGQDVNVVFSVNNTGKSILYNVTAKFSDKNGLIHNNEIYLGNIESGKSGSVDIYLATREIGETSVNLIVTYEDEIGALYTHTENAELTVSPKKAVTPTVPEPPINPQTNFSWFFMLIVVITIGGIIYLVMSKRKKEDTLAESDMLIAAQLGESIADTFSAEDDDVEF